MYQNKAGSKQSWVSFAHNAQNNPPFFWETYQTLPMQVHKQNKTNQKSEKERGEPRLISDGNHKVIKRRPYWGRPWQ